MCNYTILFRQIFTCYIQFWLFDASKNEKHLKASAKPQRSQFQLLFAKITKWNLQCVCMGSCDVLEGEQIMNIEEEVLYISLIFQLQILLFIPYS